MSYNSREKKRRAKAAISKCRSEHIETIKGRHYLTLVSRPCSCNRCGNSLRKGRDCVYRNEPKEIFCHDCAILLGIKYRLSRRWEKHRDRRR